VAQQGDERTVEPGSELSKGVLALAAEAERFLPDNAADRFEAPDGTAPAPGTIETR
jgi:hypothetical protein